MSDWTPGPWEVFQDFVKAVHGKPAIDGSELLPVLQLSRGVNMEANARLIAAAPEMAELLAEWESSYDRPRTDEDADILRATRALLARLEGKSDA